MWNSRSAPAWMSGVHFMRVHIRICDLFFMYVYVCLWYIHTCIFLRELFTHTSTSWLHSCDLKVCTHAPVYVCMYICMSILDLTLCTRLNAWCSLIQWVHVCMHVCMHVDLTLCTSVNVWCSFMYAYIHTCVCIHCGEGAQFHTHTYTHTYVCTSTHAVRRGRPSLWQRHMPMCKELLKAYIHAYIRIHIYTCSAARAHKSLTKTHANVQRTFMSMDSPVLIVPKAW